MQVNKMIGELPKHILFAIYERMFYNMQGGPVVKAGVLNSELHPY